MENVLSLLGRYYCFLAIALTVHYRDFEKCLIAYALQVENSIQLNVVYFKRALVIWNM